MSNYYKSSIFYLFLAPALGGFLFGYDIGGTSYAILQLASLNGANPLSLQDQPLKTGWFVSAPSAGALLGTAILVYMEQKGSSQNNNKKKSKQWPSPIGRKTELLVAGVLYALGGSLQYLACLKWTPFCFQVVCVGRWIYGAGIGFAMHGGPTYLAETLPPSVRGMVVGAKEIAIVLGILTGYIVGNNLCTGIALEEDNNNGWAKVYGLTVLGAISMICFSKTIPESARYLVSANHVRATRDDCNADNDMNDEEIETKVQQRISSQVLESLRFVWHHKRAQEEHVKLMEIYEKQQSNQEDTMSLRQLLSDPNIRPALTAGLGLVVLQQITGQPSVLSYATPILAKVPGLGSSASILLALFKVLATSVSVILVEKNGRKTLLRIGCALMLVALMVLTIAFSETSSHDNSSLDASSMFALAGMFAYIAGYQVGFGPITWLMISEVFPQHVRGTTVALAVQANFALNALVQFLVPILQDTLGMSWTFSIFGCLTAYSLWFVQHCVPETKGLTLEEIEEKLQRMVTVKIGKNNNNMSTIQEDDDDERIHLLP